MTTNGNGVAKFRSRTLWMCWGILFMTCALVFGGKVDSGTWQIVTLGVLAAWQLRRYGDNKLAAENGGGK